MTKQDIKDAIPAVSALVVFIFFGALFVSFLELRSDYTDLKSKNSIMAQTIENYSAQLDIDINLQTIKKQDLRIKELENQLSK